VPQAGRTIYIAGAGIAGLTLALALAKFGATVVVLERHKAITEIGAGLQLSPNAMRVLGRLGLDKAIAAQSLEPAGIDVYPFRAKRPLVTLELGLIMRQKFRAPYVVIHRADLANLLFKACRRFANIDVVFGVRSFDAVSHANGVTVSIEEASGAVRDARGFAFIGADGVNSATRTGILGGPAADYRGYVVWRTQIDFEAMRGLLKIDRTSLLMAPGYHAVAYPLPHRKRFNIALFAKEKPGAVTSVNPPKHPRLPWAALKSPHFDAIMEAASDNWGFWPIATVEAPNWHSGGIGLVGDAAHAVLPFQAQGAAMAIEDAAVLAPLLMSEPDAESALRRFHQARRKRVARVARVSARNGKVFHWEWPFTLARDAVIVAQGRRGHLRRLGWLYDYDATPDAESRPEGQVKRLRP
jgi:salicylate hydroxylase